MSARRTETPTTSPEAHDLALSTIADALESMQQNIVAMNNTIGICRKMLALALREPSEPAAPADPDDFSHLTFDDQPAPPASPSRSIRRRNGQG